MVYYVFAMVGMELFKGKVKFYEPDSGDPAKAYCGNPLLKGTAFAQLNYCKNNFNNVVSSFILLVELTVVNQWHDILSGAGGGACRPTARPSSSPLVSAPPLCSRSVHCLSLWGKAF